MEPFLIAKRRFGMCETLAASLLLGGAVTGCSNSPTTADINCLVNGTCLNTTADGSTTTPYGDAGASTGNDATTGGTTTTTPTGATATALTDGAGIPCDLRPVINDRCGLCHSDPPTYGSPMPLTSQADFAAPTPSDASRTVADYALERIHATTSPQQMPPVGQPALTADELSSLSDWLSSGAPASTMQCDTQPTPTTDPDAGAVEAPPTDTDVTCYKLLAHAPGDKSQPYAVGVAKDRYMNFTFMPEWSGTVYARDFIPQIDNKQALHHWLLYKNTSAGIDGDVANSSGAHPTGDLLCGYAPGGQALRFDQISGDVSMALESDVSYTLEIHYNSSDAAAVDASGVEICVKTQPTKDLAAIAWLGTDAIFGTTASGTCSPSSTDPIHILGITPHMHLKGQHMKAVINRANGSTEILHDQDFDFNYQTFYTKDVWIQPGDTITTTCSYSSFATFGEGTSDEMCYLFTLHTPAGALSSPGVVGNAFHGANACLGL